MRTMVYRPLGIGPFPLVIISHGSSSNPEIREQQNLSHFENLALWFVRRGYVVAIPQRPGHGETGGKWLEDYGSCDDAQYTRAGFAIADSISATISYLLEQPFIKKIGIVLVGHSAGAWGSIALASRNPRSVAAVINFAGGLGGRSYDEPNRNCVPDRLIRAAAAFGRTSRIPTLWLYAENDSYFSPALSAQLASAFRAQGGRAEYHLLPAYEPDGHFIIFSNHRASEWLRIMQRFLERVEAQPDRQSAAQAH